jgi:O-antigen/teichoic acid export membrane protein
LLAPSLRQFTAARKALAAEIRRHWHLAAPLLLANLLAAFSNQWFLWLLAAGHDVASAGALVAVSNIVAFSQPLMFGLENVLVPEIARRRVAMNFGALTALLGRRLLAVFALTLPVFLAVLIWPEAILRLVYGAHKSYSQYALALRLMALAYMTYLAGFSLSATLRGYRRAGDVLRMNFHSALLGLSLGTWLVLRDGVTGACLAALLCGALRVAIGCYFVNRLRELTVPERDEIVAA